MAFMPSEDVAQPGHLMDRTALSQCVFVLSQCGYNTRFVYCRRHGKLMGRVPTHDSKQNRNQTIVMLLFLENHVVNSVLRKPVIRVSNVVQHKPDC